jgi:hypothetical protein
MASRGSSPREDEARSLKATILVAFLLKYGVTFESKTRVTHAKIHPPHPLSETCPVFSTNLN